jgi:hypothetical protein
MRKKDIKPEPATREARIGLGLTFPGINGYWSDTELQSNHRKENVGVPCSYWSEDERRYRYYIVD